MTKEKKQARQDATIEALRRADAIMERALREMLSSDPSQPGSEFVKASDLMAMACASAATAVSCLAMLRGMSLRESHDLLAKISRDNFADLLSRFPPPTSPLATSSDAGG